MYCTKELVTNVKFVTKSKTFFENFTRFSENQKTSIKHIGTKFNNILNTFKNIMNQIAIFTKISILFKIVFNIDFLLHEILKKYLFVINCSEEMSGVVSKLLLNIDLFHLINLNLKVPNDLKSILDTINLLNTLFGKFTALAGTSKEIWDILKKCLCFLAQLKSIERFFCDTNIILSTMKLIYTFLNNFLKSFNDLLKKEKICIEKALRQTIVLEIICEHLGWLKICRIIIELLRPINVIFSQICNVIDEGQEMLKIFLSLLKIFTDFYKNIHVTWSSVIAVINRI